jgi:hypothetical protein
MLMFLRGGMKFRRGLLSIGLLLCVQPLGAQSVEPVQSVPDFRVIVQGTFDPETLADFNKRVLDYTALRTKLEAGLPPLVITSNPDEIDRFERRLTERLRQARPARRGQVFTMPMAKQVRQMLMMRVSTGTREAIMDDAPEEFDVHVNGTYSKHRPLATMPPSILLVLPDLPPGLEYRFVGRHLILRDTHANMIIDEVDYALDCRQCTYPPLAKPTER